MLILRDAAQVLVRYVGIPFVFTQLPQVTLYHNDMTSFNTSNIIFCFI